VRRDYRQGNTVVGAIVTGVRRDLGNPDLESLVRSSAWAGGLDLNHYWSSRRWSLYAMFMGSRVEGSYEAIASTQLSSARYFQRPDADYLEYDTTGTSLTGYAGQISINKIAGKHGQGSLTYQEWSRVRDQRPRIPERGGQPRPLHACDVQGQHAAQGDPELGRVRLLQLVLEFRRRSHLSGVRRRGGRTFSNYWFGYLRGEWYPGSIDDRLTRGGPLSACRPAARSRPRSTPTPGARQRWDYHRAHLGRRGRTSAPAHCRHSVASIANVAWLRWLGERPPRKARAASVIGAVETFGSRYVFASLHQTQISLDTRVEWTFSPKLSFQLYVQPLIVSGDYTRFKELRAPRQFEFDVYGKQKGTVGTDSSGAVVIDPDAGGPAPSFDFSNPDFNFRSFRGNAVLRWEYRPGSALFLVWQQGRRPPRRSATSSSHATGTPSSTSTPRTSSPSATYWLATSAPAGRPRPPRVHFRSPVW
jgi:hypothetical protein